MCDLILFFSQGHGENIFWNILGSSAWEKKQNGKNEVSHAEYNGDMINNMRPFSAELWTFVPFVKFLSFS